MSALHTCAAYLFFASLNAATPSAWASSRFQALGEGPGAGLRSLLLLRSRIGEYFTCYFQSFVHEGRSVEHYYFLLTMEKIRFLQQTRRGKNEACPVCPPSSSSIFHLPSASTTNVLPPPDDINHGPPSAIGPLAAGVKTNRYRIKIMVLCIIDIPN